MDSFDATDCVHRTLHLIHNLVRHLQDSTGLPRPTRPKGKGAPTSWKPFVQPFSAVPLTSAIPLGRRCYASPPGLPPNLSTR